MTDDSPPAGEALGDGTPVVTAIDDSIREVYRTSDHVVANAVNRQILDLESIDTMTVSLNLPRKGRPKASLELDVEGVAGEWTVGGLLYAALKDEPDYLLDEAWDERERETDTLDGTEVSP